MKKYVKVKPNNCHKLNDGKIYKIIDCRIDRECASGISIKIKRKRPPKWYDAGFFTFQDMYGDF